MDSKEQTREIKYSGLCINSNIQKNKFFEFVLFFGLEQNCILCYNYSNIDYIFKNMIGLSLKGSLCLSLGYWFFRDAFFIQIQLGVELFGIKKDSECIERELSHGYFEVRY